MLTILVLIPAQPGKGDALGEALKALLAPTRKEKGCISYDTHRSNTDPDLWMMYETWESQADLDTHMKSPHLVDFAQNKMPELVKGGLDIQTFTRA